MSDDDELERMEIDPHGVLAEIKSLRKATKEALDLLSCAEVESLRLRGLKPAIKRLRTAIAKAEES